MRLRVLALVLCCVILAACRSNKPPEGVPVTPDLPEPETGVIAIQSEPTPIPKQLEGQTGVLELVISDAGFTPKLLQGAAGGQVKIHLRNTGTKSHNFVIPRYHIATSTMAPGAENYVEFTADEKGSWPFFSDNPGEPEPGIAGTLKVE